MRCALLRDISEECGFSIEQQLSLFDSIKPLFVQKPLVLVANKVDVRRFEQLSAEHQAASVLLPRGRTRSYLK